MSENKRRRLTKLEKMFLEMEFRYGELLLEEIKNDLRMHKKALRLARKRRVGYIQ